MKIISITIASLEIPLITPFITAIRKTSSVNDVVILIKTSDGKIGYGSAASTPAITGDSIESIIATIKNIIAPKLINKEIYALNDLLHFTQNCVKGNSSAKAAIDIALHDLFAQYCNLPLYKFLGANNNTITTSIMISLKDPMAMADDASKFINQGFDTIKIKLGQDATTDIERVKLVRQAVGDKCKLVVDANQGWDCKLALQIIKAINIYNVAFIEQPVKAQAIEYLSLIRHNSDNLIIADESCFSKEDALNLVKNAACDGINIKLMKSGGLKNANAIYDIATTANMKVMVGCMLESPIGIAAIASFALSKADIYFADLDPLALIKENYVIGGATLNKNKITLSQEPGLGIQGFKQGLTYLHEVQ
jgi:L-alanine-DL-glutamate epimerase-like enolase superfamily enzyme